MMFTGSRGRLLLIGLILLAVGAVALSWLLGVEPQLKALDQAKEATAQERGLNDIEQVAVAGLKAQSENLREYKRDLGEYQDAIPETAQLPDLLRELESAGSRADVTIEKLTTSPILAYTPPEWQQPAPSTGDGRLVGITIEMEATGDQTKLRDFVSRVQKLDRYITVGSVAYAVGTEASKVQVTGTTWVLMTAEAAAAYAASDAPVVAPAEEAPAE
ncbi:hypothetical protein [Leucobacter soli]